MTCAPCTPQNAHCPKESAAVTFWTQSTHVFPDQRQPKRDFFYLSLSFLLPCLHTHPRSFLFVASSFSHCLWGLFIFIHSFVRHIPPIIPCLSSFISNKKERQSLSTLAVPPCTNVNFFIHNAAPLLCLWSIGRILLTACP